MLVLNEFIEPAWRATLDGRHAPVLRVNGNQIGVHVPAGERVVEFRYRPRSLEVGLGLAALAGITGEDASAELLDAIFARFCIGK